MTERAKPKCHRRTVVAQSKLFCIEELDLEFANGEKRIFERLRGRASGAVIIVPMLDDDTVLLIREYAAGIDRYDLALPKGLVEKGEDSTAAANREIMEEIGYGAKRLSHLKSIAVAPGYFGAYTDIVLAQDLYEQKLTGDEPEEIEVVPWRLSALHDLITRDDFNEARSLAALFLVRDKLRGQTS